MTKNMDIMLPEKVRKAKNGLTEDTEKFVVKELKTTVKKSHFKRNFVVVCLLAILGVSFYAAYKLNQFFEYNRLVFRAPVQSPVLIVKRVIQTAQVTSSEVIIDPKQLSEKDLILSQKNGVMLWKVYGLESTYGKQDNCRKSGLFNGFGFKQHTKSWVCYSSFADVVLEVDNWFTEQLKTKSIPEALCYYNTGNSIRNCDYYQNYLTIK